MNSPALTRRDFLKTASVATAALALPRSMRGQSKSSANNRLNLGLIGNGLICGNHFGALIGRDDCRIVAVCDVNLAKARKMRDRAEKQYGAATTSGTYHGVDVYHYHEEILARDDIDAVFVTTPDHWHAAIANAAMIAGKDVYCEKPLTLTIPEGRILVNTARRHGRILQTGTQQRSNASFRKAAEIVRNGLIGDLKYVRTQLGHFSPAAPLAEQSIPAEFDYDRWLGPTPWRPYNENREMGNYGGGWRCYTEYGGRKNGDWGAHHFDIIQWALGMDASGPVQFIPKGFEGTPHQTHIYANGVRVERVDEGLKAMIEFTGTKGTVWVSRDDYLETDPPVLAARPLRAEDVHLYVSDDHHSDFFSCIRSRQLPIADVEIGHRSATVSHLNNIAAKLARPVRWDPANERVVDDAVAAGLLDRSRRAPYGAML